MKTITYSSIINIGGTCEIKCQKKMISFRSCSIRVREEGIRCKHMSTTDINRNKLLNAFENML